MSTVSIDAQQDHQPVATSWCEVICKALTTSWYQTEFSLKHGWLKRMTQFFLDRPVMNRLPFGKAFFSTLVMVLAAAGLLTMSGCSAGKAGSMSITSQSSGGSSLKGEFTTGLYRFDNKNQITMLLLDGPEESPNQAVTVRMFWSPRPGRTPIDKNATNATIHYIIFPDEAHAQVGVYSGAGYMFPKGTPGAQELTLAIWQSTLRLTDSTDGFKDLLGPANLKGKITLKQDDAEVERIIRVLNANIRKTLGFPRMVEAIPTLDVTGATGAAAEQLVVAQ